MHEVRHIWAGFSWTREPTQTELVGRNHHWSTAKLHSASEATLCKLILTSLGNRLGRTRGVAQLWSNGAWTSHRSVVIYRFRLVVKPSCNVFYASSPCVVWSIVIQPNGPPNEHGYCFAPFPFTKRPANVLFPQNLQWKCCWKKYHHHHSIIYQTPSV